MSLETDLYAALAPLASGRCYPDVAPDAATAPYITWQQVGGVAVNYVESVPVGRRNARIQVNCWATTRIAAAALARAAEEALIAPPLRATVLSAMVAKHEPDLRLYGTVQDVSIWYG